jgi:hypothetical protein
MLDCAWETNASQGCWGGLSLPALACTMQHAFLRRPLQTPPRPRPPPCVAPCAAPCAHVSSMQQIVCPVRGRGWRRTAGWQGAPLPQFLGLPTICTPPPPTELLLWKPVVDGRERLSSSWWLESHGPFAARNLAPSPRLSLRRPASRTPRPQTPPPPLLAAPTGPTTPVAWMQPQSWHVSCGHPFCTAGCPGLSLTSTGHWPARRWSA